MKRFLLFIAGLAAGISAAALPAKESNSILASVNGEPITLLDVLPLTSQKEYQLGVVYSGELLAKEILKLRKNAVDRLIDHKLVQAEYAKQNFKISNRDIERELDRVSEHMGCRSREEWIRRLRKEGTTLEQMRREVEKNMMVQLMMQRQVVIDGKPTPKEMYEYFESHTKDYTEAEKIGLSMLKLDLKTPDLQQEIDRINVELQLKKSTFADLVKKYNPAMTNNGYLGEIERPLLRPEFAAALKNVTQGMFAGPLQMDDGVVWLYVDSYKKAVQADFQSVENRIRSDMEKSRREQVLQEYFAKLRSRAVVEYYF